MPLDYHQGQRDLQDRFDTRRLADRLAQTAIDTIVDPYRAFIEARDMFFLATVDAEGQPQCSYKGGDPGFVRVLDERTIAFPSYDGNGMFLSLGNLAANPAVGLLFVDFEGGTRLRINGTAGVDLGDPLIETYPGAQLVVRVRTEEVFPNCKRYVHPHRRVDRSPFVPTDGDAPPVPDWKLDPWFDGQLPADDPATRPGSPSAPAMPEF
jgi:predicted pyridoxine 5'-phosphate oxidase superfamily flavin-nucleotide-binding protein